MVHSYIAKLVVYVSVMSFTNSKQHTILQFKLALSFLHEVGASCINTVPSNEPEWEHSRRLGELKSDWRSGFIAVMSDYTFSCEGIVTQWRVRWQINRLIQRRSCEICFYFHVLRPNTVQGYCGVTSIGKNQMIVVDQTSLLGYGSSIRETIFNVSETNGTRVKAGDIMGLAVTFKQSVGCIGQTVSIIEPINTTNLSAVYYRRQQFGSGSIADTEFEGFRCNDVPKEDDDSEDRERSDDVSEDDSDRYEDTDDDDESSDDSRYERQDTDGLENTDFHLYFGAPLVKAVVGKYTITLT